MRYNVSEKKIALAVLFLSIAFLLFSKVILFADPVVISEKAVLLLLAALILAAAGGLMIWKGTQKI